MALGGGTFTSQNKLIPGTYINFTSVSRAAQLSADRGIVAAPVSLNWGPAGVIEIDATELSKQAHDVLGYELTADEMQNVRDIFKYAQKAYLYRVNEDGAAATCTYADAACKGTRGNELKIVVAVNADEPAKFDVSTILGTEKVDEQIAVSNMAALKDNLFIKWKKSATLAATAGTALTGGTNLASVTGTQYSAFLDAVEPYAFHVLACPVDDTTTVGLFTAYTKRMRDTVGVKFQTVVPAQAVGTDYEGVIELANGKAGIYWLAGAEAACAVNKSCTNTVYNGEAAVTANYTQSQLEAFINAGKLAIHTVGSELRILTDINSLTTVTTEKSADFKSNQVIRVLDTLATQTAAIFNTKYLGHINNDADGRVSYWNDLVNIMNDLLKIGAIEAFDSKNIVVAEGDSKRSVTISTAVTPIYAMEQLYMTVVVG